MVEWLTHNSEWLQESGFLSFVGHGIGWFFIKVLYIISSMMEKALNSIYDFMTGSFFNTGSDIGKYLDQWFSYAKYIAIAVLTVMLVYFGIKYIIDGKVEIKSIFTHAVLAICFIVACNGIISTSLDIGTKAYDASKSVETKDANTSFSFSVIQNNVVDLKKAVLKDGAKYADKSASMNKAFKDGKSTSDMNNLKEENFDAYDWNQILIANKGALKKYPVPEEVKSKEDANEFSKAIQDVFSKSEFSKDTGKFALNMALEEDDNGNMIAKELDSGIFEIDEGYYRYATRFANIIISLILLSLAFLLTMYLISTTLINLLFTKIIAPIVAVSDLSSGQKMKNILMDIINAGVTLALTGVSFSVFIRLFNYTMSTDWNIVAKCVFLVALGVACFDGAKAFDKYLGVDVGFRDGWKAAAGAYVAGKTATSATATGSKLVWSGGKGLWNIGQKGVEAYKEYKSNKDASDGSNHWANPLSNDLNQNEDVNSNDNDLDINHTQDDNMNNNIQSDDDMNMMNSDIDSEHEADNIDNDSMVTSTGSVSDDDSVEDVDQMDGYGIDNVSGDTDINTQQDIDQFDDVDATEQNDFALNEADNDNVNISENNENIGENLPDEFNDTLDGNVDIMSDNADMMNSNMDSANTISEGLDEAINNPVNTDSVVPTESSMDEFISPSESGVNTDSITTYKSDNDTSNTIINASTSNNVSSPEVSGTMTNDNVTPTNYNFDPRSRSGSTKGSQAIFDASKRATNAPVEDTPSNIEHYTDDNPIK